MTEAFWNEMSLSQFGCWSCWAQIPEGKHYGDCSEVPLKFFKMTAFQPQQWQTGIAKQNSATTPSPTYHPYQANIFLREKIRVSLHSLYLFPCIDWSISGSFFPPLKVCYTFLSTLVFKGCIIQLLVCFQLNSVLPQDVKRFWCKLKQLTPLLCCIFSNFCAVFFPILSVRWTNIN